MCAGGAFVEVDGELVFSQTMAPELVDRIDLSLTRLDVIAGTVPLFGDLSGELCQPGVNKATAIAAVIDHLGIDRGATIGIGDGSNDLEMLDYCAVGVAMGNASPAAKSAADETTSTILDDGIWNAFRSQGLI